MSGMDRLTDDTLEKWVESLDEKAFWEGPVTFERYQLSELHSMARELLAIRRTSQAAPSPSYGLREAKRHIDAICIGLASPIHGEDHYGWLERAQAAQQALAAALSASPAQEGEPRHD